MLIYTFVVGQVSLPSGKSFLEIARGQNVTVLIYRKTVNDPHDKRDKGPKCKQ